MDLLATSRLIVFYLSGRLCVRSHVHVYMYIYMCVCACVCAASGSTEDIGALSLALQIIDASQELQGTVLHLKKLMPAAANKHADQIQPTTQGESGHKW